MDGWLHVMHVARLFRDVFGEKVGLDGWIVDMENEFANRVYNELFPIDIESMNMYIEIDEDPFNGPIPVFGWRIPYEVCDTDCLDDYQRSVAEMLIAARLVDDWPAPHTSVAWLREDSPDAEVERNLARIAALPGPIAGLADLIRLAITQEHYGNPFLDLPFHSAAYEYDWDLPPYFWAPEDIATLAILYQAARPVVERIQAFEAWFVANPGFADGDVRRAIAGPGRAKPKRAGNKRLVEMPKLVGTLDDYLARIGSADD